MEQEKKKFHPIRAIVIMIILIILIALPPIFRVLFPKVEEATPTQQDAIKIITCTRSYPTESIRETAEIRYINSKIDQTRITYEPYAATREMEEPVINQEETILPSQELAYFQALPGIQIDQIDTRTLITINEELINQNSENTDLKQNYFNDDQIEQKLYFTNRYFECSEEEIN